MFDADKGTAAQLNGSELHIGLVQARFNEGITNTLAAACQAFTRPMPRITTRSCTAASPPPSSWTS